MISRECAKTEKIKKQVDDELRQTVASFKLFISYLISVIACRGIYIYLNEFITIEWRDL